MRRVTSTLRAVVLGAMCLMAIYAPQTGFAQNPTQKPSTPAAQPATSEWLSMSIVQIKPEMAAEYVEFLKNERVPAYKKAGLAWRDTWVTGIFGKGFEYIFVSPIPNFAQYDNPQGPIVRALGEEAARAHNAKNARFTTSVHTYALRTRPDLSYEGKMDGPPNIGVVSRVRVAPGRNAEWENYIKNEFLPVIKKSNVPGYLVSQVAFGGDANEYITLTLHKNFAEIDQGPPAARVLGREGAMKLAQKLAPGVVVNVERSISRYRPDLSIMPTTPAQTSNK